MHEVCVLRNKIGLEIIFKFFESKKRQDVSDDLKSHIGDLKKKKKDENMHSFHKVAHKAHGSTESLQAKEKLLPASCSVTDTILVRSLP